jgi:hypothetical protein
MKSGGHGVDFKYLPVHQAKPSENFPRIVQIAGIYPGIKPEELFAPPPSLPVKKGITITITTTITNTNMIIDIIKID